jgi:hypothetical protein
MNNQEKNLYHLDVKDNDLNGFSIYNNPTRDIYEERIKRIQQDHLRRVGQNQPFQPCLHDGCSECHGTGVKLDGSPCIHFISCPCPKCSPRY